MEIVALAIGRVPVDRHTCSRIGNSQHINGGCIRSAGVLVEAVCRVITCGGCPPASLVAVADVVKSIIELLAVHRAAILPVFVSRSHLAQLVVGVHPIATVPQSHSRALVGVVVLIAVGERQLARGAGHRGDGLEAVQEIILLRRRQSRGGDLFERERIHQRRVGKAKNRSRLRSSVNNQ